MHFGLMAAALVFLAAPVAAAIHTESVSYSQGGTEMVGYLAYDDSVSGKRPGVLIIHDWMGEGPYGHMRAEELAKLGYVAFAADMYGKDVRPKSPQEAVAASGALKNDIPTMRARANAALDVLKNEPHVNAGRLAVMGYCFGGMVATELARSGADLRGTVTFHGSFDTDHPDDMKNIHGSVLILHGADDKATPVDKVRQFQQQMDAAGVDYQVVLYSGAVHSFTRKDAGNDPSKGVAYNEKADRRSWDAMRRFYNEIF